MTHFLGGKTYTLPFLSSDHDMAVNVDVMNSEFIDRSQEVWDKVEKDRWIYDLDQEEGFVPNFNRMKK